jgi:Tfp pilus assembly protein PilX
MSVEVRRIPRQSGSALVAAMFLLVVVGTLGIFAARLQANQQQGATLQLQEYRGSLAAQAGLEYWSYHLAHGNAGLCPAVPATGSQVVTFSGFAVTATCSSIATGTGSVVYVVTSDAQAGTFGTPDFVRRSATRRMQSSPAVFD